MSDVTDLLAKMAKYDDVIKKYTFGGNKNPIPEGVLITDV